MKYYRHPGSRKVRGRPLGSRDRSQPRAPPVSVAEVSALLVANPTAFRAVAERLDAQIQKRGFRVIRGNPGWTPNAECVTFLERISSGSLPVAPTAQEPITGPAAETPSSGETTPDGGCVEGSTVQT